MKTTMTISLEKDLKKNFTNFSRSLWTNPTNLLSMMMKNTLNSWEVKFSANPFLDIEVESFWDEEIKSLKNNKSIQKNTKKLERIFK
jgi:hypothetical protein